MCIDLIAHKFINTFSPRILIDGNQPFWIHKTNVSLIIADCKKSRNIRLDDNSPDAQPEIMHGLSGWIPLLFSFAKLGFLPEGLLCSRDIDWVKEKDV